MSPTFERLKIAVHKITRSYSCSLIHFVERRPYNAFGSVPSPYLVETKLRLRAIHIFHTHSTPYVRCSPSWCSSTGNMCPLGISNAKAFSGSWIANLEPALRWTTCKILIHVAAPTQESTFTIGMEIIHPYTIRNPFCFAPSVYVCMISPENSHWHFGQYL